MPSEATGAAPTREFSTVQRAGAANAQALPLADGITEDAASERKAKNDRYDRMFPHPLDLKGAPKQMNVRIEWWEGLPSLPVAQSDLVVLGRIVDARAHLTRSRSGIYSEFTVDVAEKLYGSHGAQRLVAERAGGAVLHANGGVSAYTVEHQGMPRIGETYVLFLRRAGSDYRILTGYALTGGRATPLDGTNATLGFERHAGTEANAFVQQVRAAVASNSK